MEDDEVFSDNCCLLKISIVCLKPSFLMPSSTDFIICCISLWFVHQGLFGNHLLRTVTYVQDVSLYSNLFIFGHIFVTFWTSVIWSPKFGMCHHHSWKTFMYSEREIVLYLKMQIYYSNCHIRSTLSSSYILHTRNNIVFYVKLHVNFLQIIMANFKNLGEKI